jgi:hypothetical protein
MHLKRRTAAVASLAGDGIDGMDVAYTVRTRQRVR